ncbi:hypothetical protein TNCV_5056591 [Trichonephila clavipes]|nr:hypothetical protein TNCV_5056591 [Trichonephila clavipes]
MCGDPQRCRFPQLRHKTSKKVPLSFFLWASTPSSSTCTYLLVASSALTTCESQPSIPISVPEIAGFCESSSLPTSIPSVALQSLTN